MENEEIIFPTLAQTIRKLKDDITFEKQTNVLVSYEPFPQKAFEYQKKLKTIFENPQKNLKESKAIACFIGLSIGDALGAISDGWDLSYDRFEIFSFDYKEDSKEKRPKIPIGLYTDDTAMGLCIADSILTNNFDFNPIDIRHRFLLWWFEGYNNGKGFVENETLLKYSFSNEWDLSSFGIGNTVWNSLFKFFRNPSSEIINENFGDLNSNGSLMRLAPIPIAFHEDLEKTIDYSFRQSRMTNDGLEAAECCILASIVIFFLINNENENFEKLIESSFKYYNFESEEVISLIKSNSEFNWKDKDFIYNEKRANQNNGKGIGAYCLDAMAMAFHTINFAKSFEECILKIANLGGDADTVGAITGMLSGAKFGIDSRLLKMYDYVRVFDKDRVAIRALQLFNKNN